MRIGESSLRLINTISSISSNKDKDGRLIMFDCASEDTGFKSQLATQANSSDEGEGSWESQIRYNHCFHEHCLKRHIKEELRKNKKASLKEADLIKEFRCVICQNESQGISGSHALVSKTAPEAKSSSRSASRRPGRDRSTATPRRGAAATTAADVSDTSSQSSTTNQSYRTSFYKKTFEEE